MKILWIVNTVLPELAAHLGVQTSASGSWMEDLSKKISTYDDIELAIAAVSGSEFKDITIGDIRYFLLPGSGRSMLFYSKRLVKYWKQIKENYEPDLVHLHGTEYSHGLSFLRKYPEVKSVVSVQGLLTRIKDVALEGIPLAAAVWFRTLKENFRLNGMIENALLLRVNARYEQEILRRVGFANTVNFWDMSIAKDINQDLKIFQIDYNLRDAFYASRKWDIGAIERYTLFTNPSTVPLKGFHILLKALRIVKKSYPAVKLLVLGIPAGRNGRPAVVNGYVKYIDHLLSDYQLNENVVFLGRLSGQQMVETMLKSHIVVIPSAIEGTSLMLREAMFLGVPSIASFRGGMADFVNDKISGYLYDYPEYAYLAQRILTLFEKDDLAATFSKNAILQAEKAHDRKKNPDKYMEMYKEILTARENQ